jgi:hypothetical protein
MACAIEARKFNAMVRGLAMGVVERAIERAQERVVRAITRSYVEFAGLLNGVESAPDGNLSGPIFGDGSGVALLEISEQWGSTGWGRRGD